MTVPVLCGIISECEDDIATKTHSALSSIPEKLTMAVVAENEGNMINSNGYVNQDFN